MVLGPGEDEEGGQTTEDEEAAADEEGEEEAPEVEEEAPEEGSDGGAGPEHGLHHGQHCGLTAPVAPHGQRVDGAAHGGLSYRRERPHQQREAEEGLTVPDGGEEAEHDVGQAGADTAEYEEPGRAQSVEIFPEDGSGDDLEEEGGGEDQAAAGDGHPVVLGLLGVEGSQDGESAARQEDGEAEHHQGQEPGGAARLGTRGGLWVTAALRIRHYHNYYHLVCQARGCLSNTDKQSPTAF